MTVKSKHPHCTPKQSRLRASPHSCRDTLPTDPRGGRIRASPREPSRCSTPSESLRDYLYHIMSVSPPSPPFDEGRRYNTKVDRHIHRYGQKCLQAHTQKHSGVLSHPHGSQSSLSPWRSALGLNPVSGLGVGGSPAPDRERGVTGPQASGRAFSYACNFLSPFLPSSSWRLPPRRPPPHPKPQHRKGGPAGGAESLSRKKTQAAHTRTRRSHGTLHARALSPGAHGCGRIGRFIPEPHASLPPALPQKRTGGQSFRLRSARPAGAWLPARVQHSLTLCD